MDNPERHLRDFIHGYYYGEVTEETVANDANELIKFMRERGWHFTLLPADVHPVD